MYKADDHPAMKIVIMGAPISSGNRGVSALGASLVNLCAGASNGAEIVMLLNTNNSRPGEFRVLGERRLIKVVNARLSPRSKVRDHLLWIILMALCYRLVPVKGVRRTIIQGSPWIRSVAEADLVGNVHGGDSFSDIYGLRGFLLNISMNWTILLVRGDMIQFPQTFGPYKSTISKLLARYVLKRSSVIIARDTQSKGIAQALVGPMRDVTLSPDVAFSLEAVQIEKVETKPTHVGSSNRPVIGLNVNGLMYHGGYSRRNMFGLKLDYASLLPSLVAELLAKHPGELWLVPHTFAPVGHVESDPDACQILYNALSGDLRDRVRIVTREYDQNEIKGVIGKFDFFIGSRMHACIAALSQGVPCIGIAYSMKFSGVFESVGMGDWVIDGRNATNDQALLRVSELYSQRAAVRVGLEQRAAMARLELQQVFRELVRSKHHSGMSTNYPQPLVNTFTK